MKATRTIGQLRFEDLDPKRFEDLANAIIYKHRNWLSIHPYGKKGKDYGIDLKAIEELENNKQRIWHFQHKRIAELHKNGVEKIIEEYVKDNTDRPDIYVLVASCGVSKKTEEAFETCAKENGFAVVQLMARPWIECILYNERQNLLFAYFGISLTDERNQRVNRVRQNITLKKRMMKDFVDLSKSTRDERMKDPSLKFAISEVLIRSIDDNTYPESEEYGAQKWYKAEIYDFYHNGLAVMIANRKVRLKDGEEIVCAELGYIPYSNIIDYDYDGDGQYPYPHLFCDFTNINDPYEKIGYCHRHDSRHQVLGNDDILEVVGQ